MSPRADSATQLTAEETAAATEQRGDWVTSCWHDMQQRAASGRPARAEDYLADAPSDSDAIDVIYAEYTVRTSLGERLAPRDYLQRFARYADALSRQFAFDEAFSSINEMADITQVESRANESTTDISPVKIGKYTVIAPLSSGGQAEVFRAVHPELHQEVVIKLAAEGANASSNAKQLLAEARILAELDHPNLGRVYDAGVHAERPYLVSRYIRGLALDDFARQNPMSPWESARLVAQIARGLATAHRRGIVHLDVKPRNVVVDEQGHPCLIDFGLGTVRDAFHRSQIEDGGLRGTLPYMSPEQAAGDTERIGPGCDVFGLGAVLFFLLTGEAPYANKGLTATLDKVRRGDWRRELISAGSAPAALRRIVERSLDPDPRYRFQSCEELADSLDAFCRPARVTRRSMLATAFAIGVPAIFAWGWRQGWFNRPTDLPNTDPPTAAIEPPEFLVDVFANGRFVDLAERTPLETGDQLRITTAIPPGYHASLFLLAGSGDVKELGYYPPSTRRADARYPSQPGTAAPIVGPPGTDVIMLCVRRDSRVTRNDLVTHLEGHVPLPSLPPLSVLVADVNGVHVKQSARDLGPPQELPDSEEIVVERLNEMRRSMSGSLDFFRAIAFFHAE